MSLAEVADRAKVGVLVGRQDPEGDILVGLGGDGAGTDHALAVGVEQELGEQDRVVGRVAPAVALVVDRRDRRQVQVVH